MADRTFVIIKPDAVERGLSGEILSRFERKGLRIVAMDLRTIESEIASRHYEEHHGKPFYDELLDFIGRGPSIALVLEGPEDTWKVVRTLMGATNPRESAPGTIRGDYGILLTENLVHGSDGPESAAREIGIFFPEMA
jgi:nucleoside-diphosphate kinase